MTRERDQACESAAVFCGDLNEATVQLTDIGADLAAERERVERLRTAALALEAIVPLAAQHAEDERDPELRRDVAAASAALDALLPSDIDEVERG